MHVSISNLPSSSWLYNYLNKKQKFNFTYIIMFNVRGIPEVFQFVTCVTKLHYFNIERA